MSRPGRGHADAARRRSPLLAWGGEDGVRGARSLLRTARCLAQRPRRAPTPRHAGAFLLLPYTHSLKAKLLASEEGEEGAFCLTVGSEKRCSCLTWYIMFNQQQLLGLRIGFKGPQQNLTKWFRKVSVDF